MPAVHGLAVEPSPGQTNRPHRRRHLAPLQKAIRSPDDDALVRKQQEQLCCEVIAADTSRSRENVRHIMDTALVPTNERSFRRNFRYTGDGKGTEDNNKSDDTSSSSSSSSSSTTTRTGLLYHGYGPTLYETYGEFPLSSLDQLRIGK